MAKAWTDIYNSLEGGQFTPLADKAAPVSADLLLLEDSASSGAKKKVQIGNLPGGAADLTDAEFPTFAVFDGKVTGAAAIDFTTGNKQEVDAATHNNITVASPTGKPANFMLAILNSGSLVSIAPAAGGGIDWENGTPPEWAGKTVLALYYDGTGWTGSGIVNAS